MPPDALLALVFLLFWISLAVVMLFGYRWLRNQERDTRLTEEEGREPRIEVIGAGRINQRRWSRGRACRVSVYDDFLVVSVDAQRRRLQLYLIREIDEHPEDHLITIRGLAEDESTLSIDFRGPDAERLAAYLREYGRGIKVARPV